jgi:hypothetical protein
MSVNKHILIECLVCVRDCTESRGCNYRYKSVRSLPFWRLQSISEDSCYGLCVECLVLT